MVARSGATHHVAGATEVNVDTCHEVGRQRCEHVYECGRPGPGTQTEIPLYGMAVHIMGLPVRRVAQIGGFSDRKCPDLRHSRGSIGGRDHLERVGTHDGGHKPGDGGDTGHVPRNQIGGGESEDDRGVERAAKTQRE